MDPRIITGSARGKKMKVPGKGTRPMTDRAKSGLFSIIDSIIPKSIILDLYAGTGALGIECLSRGAKKVIFVDRSKEAVDCIQDNLNSCGVESLAKIFKASVSRFLIDYDKFNTGIEKFDIIFFTPPYSDFKENVLKETAAILSNDGIIITEHSKNRKIADRIGNLEKIDTRKYGKTMLSFYKKAV